MWIAYSKYTITEGNAVCNILNQRHNNTKFIYYYSNIPIKSNHLKPEIPEQEYMKVHTDLSKGLEVFHAPLATLFADLSIPENHYTGTYYKLNGTSFPVGGEKA